MATEEKMQYPLAEGVPASGPAKMTDWVNEPTLLTLKEDMEMSKNFHDSHVTKVQHWNDLMRVKGKSKITEVKGRSSVQPKLIRRQAEWRYSALTEPFLSAVKLFTARPSTFEDETAARQNELLLNWQFQTKINRVKFIDDFVRSNVDEGSCIVQVGWKRTVVPMQEEVPVWEHYAIQDEEGLNLFQQALDAKQENPRMFDQSADAATKAALEYFDETQQPTTAVQIGTETVVSEKVLQNFPTVDIRDLQNVWVDPTCQGDLDKALFVIVSFETCKADLLKEPQRYKNVDKINFEGNTPITQPDHKTTTPDTFQFKDQLRKKVVAYEYWGFYDITGDGSLKPFVCTWIGNQIIRMELNPFPDEKLPFVITNYLPVKRELMGEPDAELLEDNQRILGAVTRGMIDLMGRSANAQQGFAKGMLDPMNRRRFEEGKDYEFNPNANPQSNLVEHKYPEIPQSALQMLNLQNQDAEALTGVKSFSGGVSGDAYGDVAAGIRGALDAASKREVAILRRLAKGIVEIGQKFSAMNAVFLSEKEVVRVTNEEYVTVLREDLVGNFDLQLDISTAEVDAQKSQDLAFMLQTLGPKADPSMVMMILTEIAELKRMPALAHKLRTWEPTPPTPEQQRLAKLEVLKAEAEIDKLAAESEWMRAKAQEALANKDKKNLDYVEQETGTTHERGMEEMRAQSQGNQNLQITKALTAPKKEKEQKPNIEAAIGFNALSGKLNSNERPDLPPTPPVAVPVPVQNQAPLPL